MKTTIPAILCAASIILGGCGTAETSNTSMISRISAAISGAQNNADKPRFARADLRALLTPELIAQLPAPFILLEVEETGAATLIGAVAENNGVETYLTSDDLSLSLRDGMIVATRGFGFDLMTADVTQSLRALRSGGGSAVRTHSYLDGEDHLVTEVFNCSFGATSDGQMRETCQGSAHSFENSYVLGPRGTISFARQWISPEIGWLIVERVNRTQNR